MKNVNVEQKTASEDDSGVVQSEVQEYLNVRQQRRWIFPRAMLVGAAAGLVALAFRMVLSGADTLRTNVLLWAHSLPFAGWLVPILFTMIGAALAIFITRKYAPEASGSGIPHLEAVLRRFQKMNWKRVLPVKFVGGALAIGSGLALGREGPIVQMGGAIGDAISRWLKVSERERLTLISAGAGAGLAAAFNAPFSGLIFVLEEVRRDFHPIVFGAAFVAAVVADIIARIGSGQFPVFAVPNYPTPPLGALPIFALLGIAAGLLGILFNRTLMRMVTFFGQIQSKYRVLAAAVAGGFIGLIGWFSPLFLGSGHTLAESALSGQLALSLIPIFFIVRFLLTTTSYGAGTPGGIFAPLLVLGALLGLGIGQLGHNLFPGVVPIPAVFAVVGMAAYFTAIVRAPLTGIMLIIEMTRNYSLMLPLLVGCFFAYIAAEFFKDVPIYEALLERDLRLKGDTTVLEEPAVVEFTIKPGAPFVGQQIRSLGLPPGCILVLCSDGKHEWIPKANTRLDVNMHLTAVISPDAQSGMDILRHGCEKTRSD
jgi:CIC family chloride channel protein